MFVPVFVIKTEHQIFQSFCRFHLTSNLLSEDDQEDELI